MTTPAIARPRGLPASYVGMWLLLLSLSFLYLAGVALKPELMAEILPPTRLAVPESNEGSRSAARALAEADALRQELQRSKAELAEARAELAGKAQTAAAPQPAASEPVPAAKAEPAPAPAPPPVKATAVQRAADKVKAAKQAAAPATGQAEPQTAQAAASGGQPFMQPGRILNGQAEPPASITTGSIAAPGTVAAAAAPAVPAFGAPVVKPAKPEPSGPHAVQLASGPSLDALRLSWVLLTERHGASLKGLEPRYVAGHDPAGQAFDLLAGPLPSAEKAAEVCAALKAKKVACAVGPFSGNAL